MRQTSGRLIQTQYRMLQTFPISATLPAGPLFGSVAMRPPSLGLEDPLAKRQELLALAERVPGAWRGSVRAGSPRCWD